MTAAGEELIRDIWRRWNEGERRLNPEVTDPEIEIHSALAGGEVFTGEDGLLRWMAEIDEQFEAWDIGIDEIQEIKPDRYLLHGSIHARGRGSGMDLDQPASWIIDLHQGRARRMWNFIGSDAGVRAKAAAG